MVRPGGDADGIASMEAEFLTVEPDVHIAIFDIRSLFPVWVCSLSAVKVWGGISISTNSMLPRVSAVSRL